MITVGLIRGRHEIPVSDYIWDSIENPMDFLKLRAHCYKWIEENVMFQDTKIVIYVTGLTCALTEMLSVCIECKLHVTLMHFDRETETYKPQFVF